MVARGRQLLFARLREGARSCSDVVARGCQLLFAWLRGDANSCSCGCARAPTLVMLWFQLKGVRRAREGRRCFERSGCDSRQPCACWPGSPLSECTRRECRRCRLPRRRSRDWCGCDASVRRNRVAEFLAIRKPDDMIIVVLRALVRTSAAVEFPSCLAGACESSA